MPFFFSKLPNQEVLVLGPNQVKQNKKKSTKKKQAEQANKISCIICMCRIWIQKDIEQVQMSPSGVRAIQPPLYHGVLGDDRSHKEKISKTKITVSPICLKGGRNMYKQWHTELKLMMLFVAKYTQQLHKHLLLHSSHNLKVLVGSLLKGHPADHVSMNLFVKQINGCVCAYSSSVFICA